MSPTLHHKPGTVLALESDELIKLHRRKQISSKATCLYAPASALSSRDRKAFYNAHPEFKAYVDDMKQLLVDYQITREPRLRHTEKLKCDVQIYALLAFDEEGEDVQTYVGRRVLHDSARLSEEYSGSPVDADVRSGLLSVGLSLRKVSLAIVEFDDAKVCEALGIETAKDRFGSDVCTQWPERCVPKSWRVPASFSCLRARRCRSRPAPHEDARPPQVKAPARVAAVP